MYLTLIVEQLLQLDIPFVMIFAVAKIMTSPSGTVMQVKQMLG